MSAIAGCTADRRPQVAGMLQAMTHRGPDDSGVTFQHGVTLGHNRLSIIDLTGGRQPLTNEDRSLWLTLSGEIYNFRELRRRLEARGHRFATRTDGETILHLYEEEGPELVRSLYGMFAFALATPQGLMLARDPLGMEPLYTGRDRDGHLYFASEMKALLPHVATIEEFPPGHYWTPRTGLVRYFDLPPVTEDVDDVDRAAALVTERLREAVRARLVADVPVGVFLSGGLDSSLIAAFCAEAMREAGQDLHSFAVGMAGSEDLERARLVARHLGTIHHELVFDRDDLIRLLPEVVARLESYDPALVRSALPTYLVSGLARRYVTVVLSGEGADELFAGYHYLKAPDVRGRLQEELQDITRSMHNTNLQRVDRMSMAHSLQVRVPFLSTRLLALAWRIPARWKLHSSGTEKWLLRRIARDYLPEGIWTRRKAKFAIGTGVGPSLESYADTVISDAEFAREREQLAGLGIETKEALLYYRYFEQAFGPRAREAARLIGFSRSLNPGQIYRKDPARRGA